MGAPTMPYSGFRGFLAVGAIQTGFGVERSFKLGRLPDFRVAHHFRFTRWAHPTRTWRLELEQAASV